MKQPNNSIQVPKPARNTRQNADKLNILNERRFWRSKDHLIYHVAR